MSLLSKVEKPTAKPVIATILGDAGLGKTSLAATFPKPIVIRAEDGLQSIPESDRPDAFPMIEQANDVWAQFTALINEDHPYQTLIVDSATALERMFCQQVVDNDPKKPNSINTALGGYGNGLAAVAAMHQRARKAAGILRDKKGMHVIFIAHAEIETLSPPDGDDYSRFNLRMGKRSVAPYTDDVDMVAFIKLQTFVRGDDGEKKKAISTGDRIIVTHATASNVSKNRYGIEEEIPFPKGVNPFINYIPSLSKGN